MIECGAERSSQGARIGSQWGHRPPRHRPDRNRPRVRSAHPRRKAVRRGGVPGRLHHYEFGEVVDVSRGAKRTPRPGTSRGPADTGRRTRPSRARRPRHQGTRGREPAPRRDRRVTRENAPLADDLAGQVSISRSGRPFRRDVHFALESAVPTVILECKMHISASRGRRFAGRSSVGGQSGDRCYSTGVFSRSQ